MVSLFPIPSRGALLGLLIALVAFPVASVAHAADTTAPRSGKWAHETVKLEPDPRVVWGRLDNGFRYALLPHHGVPGRVALQLVVLSGSLDERPNELGIAHFTEHLAFGGSKNFKADDMVALFQRLGVEYGSDVNAVTTFDYTAYRLDFRDNTQPLIKEGLRLFRDFGDGVTFDPVVIERERRVVLAELRNRSSLSDQQQQASLPVVFRGLQFPNRTPGGSEAQIAKFTRDDFLRFYQRNYRSDLMVLVGAGDFDPAFLSAEIQEIFGSMQRPREPVPGREEGRLDARSLRAGLFRIGGVGSASAEVASVVPPPSRPDPRQVLVDQQRREFVMGVFGERLRTQLPGAMGAQAGYDQLLGYGVAMASMKLPAQAWAESVKGLDQMVRLTLDRGLDPNAVETARRRQLKMAGHMIDQLPTMDPGMFCEALTDSITNHDVFVGVDRKFAWMREWLERFSPNEAQQVFRSMWNPSSMAFHLSGGLDLDLTESKVVQEIQKGRRTGLTHVMPHAQRETPFKLPRFSTPTQVVDRSELPSLKASLMRFGNNARLNFIPNRQEPGLVHVVVRVGTGLLDMPGNKPALKEFGLNTLMASGAVHFRPEQLNALIDERFLDFSFDVSDRDAFTFRGMMAVEQLETFLGIVADILNAPQFNGYVHRDERLRAAMGRASQSVGMGDGLRGLTDHLFRGDARFTWGSPMDYLSMSVLDVRRWMEPSLARGYIETTVVGDLTEQEAVEVVSRTLGALKPRAERKVTAAPPGPVAVTASPGFTRIEFVGEQNVGLVVGTWPVTAALHVRDQAALELLAKVLELRVRGEVREKLGLAYSPSAEFRAYDGFSNFALLQTQIDCAPNDTSKVAPLIEKIGAELAERGVQYGEFIGARGILRSQLRGAFRENSFLVNVLMRAQERPEETEQIVALHGGLMDTISLEEVNKWAKQVLPASNCRTAAIVPKAFVGMFDGGR
jgi:zinc protease